MAEALRLLSGSSPMLLDPHDKHDHSHAHHGGHGHARAHASAAPAGWSLLRASVAERLMGSAVLLAVLWALVIWAMQPVVQP